MAQEDRYTQIIIEETRRQIKILAEGHQMQVDKLNNLKQKVDAIELRLDCAGIPKKIM
jgi:hypothetical protein